MQKIILAFLLFCVAQANAIYFSTSIGDSRIQSKNKIYKPGGIIHYAFEIGFLNAPNPENILDYKFAIGIDRFGYSHSDGEKSVSLWEVYLKPVVFSVTKHSVMFEIAPYLGRLLDASGLTVPSASSPPHAARRKAAKASDSKSIFLEYIRTPQKHTHPIYILHTKNAFFSQHKFFYIF